METLNNINIIVAAENKLFCEMLKQTMEVNLGKDVLIKTVYSKNACISEIVNTNLKMDIAVLDYQQTKTSVDADCLQAVTSIKKASPETYIIIISSESEMAEASKLLAHGADDYVLKDKFAFSHVAQAVKGCLHPSQS
jgi:DNA-binding NarL/FixJ family response regulator